MIKNEGRVSKDAYRVSKYSAISTDIWFLFKKYLPTNADLTTFTEDVHALDRKYHDANDLDTYRFMQKLMKVYFDELGVIKNGEKDKN